MPRSSKIFRIEGAVKLLTPNSSRTCSSSSRSSGISWALAAPPAIRTKTPPQAATAREKGSRLRGGFMEPRLQRNESEAKDF